MLSSPGSRRDDDVHGEDRPRDAASAMHAPATRRPRASAYQMPSAAIGSPISSPVDIARTAQTREGNEPVGVEEPDAEEQERDRERHRVDRGRRAHRDPRIREVARGRAARRRAPSRGGDGRARRPAARRATTTAICAKASASGDGQTIQSGASSTRNGSTWDPSRTICSPVARRSSRGAARRPCSRRPAPCSRGRSGRSETRGRRPRDDRRRAHRPDDHRRPDRERPRVRRARTQRRARRRSRVRARHRRRARSRRRGVERLGARRRRATASAARAHATASATVSAATASVHAVSNGVGCPLPGRDDHASGTNQTTPSRGCASATTTSEQREVVQPHDRRQCERGRDREDERRSLVAAPTEQTTEREQRERRAASHSARASRRRKPESRARRCTRVRVLADRRPRAAAAGRVVDEPGEPDHRPRDEQQHRRRSRTRVPAAANRRVAASQTTSGQRKNFAASVTPTRAAGATRRRGNARRAQRAARTRASRCPSGSPRCTGGHRNTTP